MTDVMRDALESIAGWRKINISGEYEHGLRDIIRSIVDCAADALDAIPATQPQYLSSCLRGGECHGQCESTACTNYGKAIVVRRCVEPKQGECQ
jgi:hypothetical protein